MQRENRGSRSQKAENRYSQDAEKKKGHKRYHRDGAPLVLLDDKNSPRDLSPNLATHEEKL